MLTTDHEQGTESCWRARIGAWYRMAGLHHLVKQKFMTGEWGQLYIDFALCDWRERGEECVILPFPPGGALVMLYDSWWYSQCLMTGISLHIQYSYTYRSNSWLDIKVSTIKYQSEWHYLTKIPLWGNVYSREGPRHISRLLPSRSSGLLQHNAPHTCKPAERQNYRDMVKVGAECIYWPLEIACLPRPASVTNR